MFDHIVYTSMFQKPAHGSRSNRFSKSDLRKQVGLTLPPDVLLKTFSYLRSSDLARLSQVSQSFFITINKMWRSLHGLHYYYHRHNIPDDTEEDSWRNIYKECTLTERYGKKLLQDLNNSVLKDKDNFLTRVNPLKNVEEPLPEFQCDFDPISITVLLVGKDHVGKTSFLRKLRLGTFDSECETTMGAQSVRITKLFCRNSRKTSADDIDTSESQDPAIEEREKRKNTFFVDLTIWDCSGQDRYSGLAQKMIQFAQVVLLFYDVTNSESVASMKQWWQDLSTKKTLVCSLVGTKCDQSKRQTSYQEIFDYSRQEYANFFGEISSKTGENVVELCDHICDLYFNTFGV